MKTKYTLFIIISLILIFTFISNSIAAAKAIFPNEHPLQPLSINIQPNLSGNINSTSTYNPDYQDSSDSQTPSYGDEFVTGTTSIDQSNSDKKTSSTNTLLWLTIFSTFVISILIWGYRKLK